MILGEDIFPIRELSQHEQELQTVYIALDAVGRKMADNRADDMEILLYQTYLLYQATLGGSIGIEIDDPRQPAFDVVDSLWRFSSDDGDVDFVLSDPFLNPQFSPDTYLEAFHELLNEKYYVIIGHLSYSGTDDLSVVDIWSQSDSYPKWSLALKAFLAPFIKSEDAGILDCNAYYLPPDFAFDRVGKYTIYERDSLFYAFLLLRKELEGDAWSNVEIINQLDNNVGKFDCVLLGRDFSNDGDSFESIDDYIAMLGENGRIVLQCKPLKAKMCNRLYASGMLSKVISIQDLDGVSQNIYLLQSNRDSDTVVFVELGFDGPSLNLLENNTVDTLKDIDPDRIISVPYSGLLESNLNPSYYLLLHETNLEGTVPLKTYLSNSVSRETRIHASKVTDENVVNAVSTDTRLIETLPDESAGRYGAYYYLSESALLLNTKRLDIGFIHIGAGKKELIQYFILAFPFDETRVDIRYLVLFLRNNPLFKIVAKFVTSADDLLELYVPELSKQEQTQYVENYLKDLKNEFNSKIDVKDSSLQLLVFTPDKAGFESDNKERMDKLGFKVLEYVEDKNSLKAALSEHYGEKVLSSNLADAVLVCADMPAMDVQKAIYFVGKVGIRTFYYSNNPKYDASDIDEDYLDDFKAGFLSGDDYLESIRKILDADSNKVRDRYPKFFKAADRLDEEYGWGLAEFATSTLQSNPFKLDINKLRSKIDETVIAFFKNHHVAPSEMDNTAVASLVADKKYYEGRKKVNIALTEELSKTTLDSEAWYKYALVAIRKLGNKDSHSSIVSDSSLELAAFTLFTEIVVWLDSVRERYKDKKCLFAIKKGNVELPFYTVESYDIDGREYLVANGIHLIDSKHELRAGDQVVVLDTEEEKYPKTINGFRVEKVANPSNYIVAIKA